MLKTCGFRQLALIASLAILAAACGDNRAEDLPAAGVIELSDQFTGEFDLIDQNGQAVSSDDLKGKVLAVYFGFATCPDVCPMALGSLSAALNELDQKDQAEVVPVFITIDPERDTPSALKDYLVFDDRLVGLSGSVEKIEAAKQSFKVYARKQPLDEPGLDYTMDHSSLFYLVDRSGQPRVALKDTLSAQQIAAAIERAVDWR